MTYQEYTATVKMLAEEVLSNTLDGYFDTLHEVVDRCEYVIYNMHHNAVLEHSSNDEYGVDQGLIAATDDLDELKQAYASWALYADVEEAYTELKAEKLEELQSELDTLSEQFETLENRIYDDASKAELEKVKKKYSIVEEKITSLEL